MRPLPATSNGGTRIVPPFSVISVAVASASSLARYTVQTVGWPSCINGPIAAAAFPFVRQMW